MFEDNSKFYLYKNGGLVYYKSVRFLNIIWGKISMYVKRLVKLFDLDEIFSI